LPGTFPYALTDHRRIERDAASILLPNRRKNVRERSFLTPTRIHLFATCPRIPPHHKGATKGSFLALAALLAIVALAATLIPARKAMKLDPVTALRYE
jgi:hypothetical protein